MKHPKKAKERVGRNENKIENNDANTLSDKNYQASI